MEQLKLLSLGVALLCAVIDVRTQRIPNRITFPVMLFGLVAQTILSGFMGGAHALLALVVGFLLFFPLYAFRGMGAGDVKLLMAIGALSDFQFTIWVAVFSILGGGLYALFDTIRVGRLGPLLSELRHFVLLQVLRAEKTEGLPFDRKRSFSFGAAIAFGVVATLLWERLGGGLG